VRTAFPDLHARIDELIGADEVIVARLTWRATHAGELFGIPATGRRFEYVGVGIFHLQSGKIQDAWIVGDTQELWRALGVAPPS
jgi:predicted ester cyclase